MTVKQFLKKNKRKITGYSLIFLGIVPLVEGGKHFIPIGITQIKHAIGLKRKEAPINEVRKLRIFDKKTFESFSELFDPDSKRKILRIFVSKKYWNSTQEVAERLRSKLKDYSGISVSCYNVNKDDLIGYVVIRNNDKSSYDIVYDHFDTSITYTHNSTSPRDLSYSGIPCDSAIVKYLLENYNYTAQAVWEYNDTFSSLVLKEFKTSNTPERTFLNLNLSIDQTEKYWYGGIGQLGIFLIVSGLYLIYPKRT